MVRHQLNVKIDPPFRKVLKSAWLTNVIKEVLKAINIDCPVELSILITDNNKIRTLNKEYRHIDKPTDVLAFTMTPFNDYEETPFITPPDGLHHLGEVIISYQRAVEQARDYDNDIEQELTVLIVHGILHLLGYDHEQADEEAKMRGKEDEIIKRINK